MPPSGNVGGSQGIAFLVSAGLVNEIIAANCSSPQTTEINADTRAKTLMKWVWIGVAESVAFVYIAAAIDRKHAPGIIAGGMLAGGLKVGYYLHARKAGLGSRQPGTET